ncbi:MAG: ABC transporter ATP-binding protein [Leucobacter sp.]|nr:ABC transporter ATP-binding protein [Leucobacter sp.]
MIRFDAAEVIAPAAGGSVRVLQPITLELTEQRIALIGANGSGKSTLARLVNGLVLPSTGTVTVRGRDTAHDGAAVRRLVGFAFTNPAAQLVMPTALEDVALSLRRTHPRKARRLDAARAVLARFGLEQLGERSVHTLSGGQQQLLALAGVLAGEPEILVADEPTTLLDLRNSRAMTELLLSLRQQLIVATHDLSLAARCERVIVMEAGAVAFDTAAEGAGPDEAVRWYGARA